MTETLVKMDFQRANSLLKSNLVSDKLQVLDFLEANVSAESVRILINVFNDADWTVRQKASEVFMSVCEPYAEQIIKMFDTNPDSFTNDQIFWLLKSMSGLSQKTEPFILKQLESSNNEIRRSAVIICGQNRIKASINKLVQCFEDNEWIIRKTASEALCCFGKGIFNTVQKVFLSNYKKQGRDDLCYWCIRTMASVWPDGIIKGYKKFLSSNDRKLKFYTYAALKYTGSASALPYLVKGLDFSDRECNEIIKEGIASQGEKSLKFLLPEFLNSKSEKRFKIIPLLGRACTGDFKSVFARIASVKDAYTKYYCLEFLRNVPSSERNIYFLNYFKDPEWKIRNRASIVVSEIGPSMIDVLLAGLKQKNNDIRFWSIMTIGRIGGKRALTILNKLFGNSDLFIQSAILSSLEKSYDSDSLKLLILMLSSEHWGIRSRAVNVLIRRGPDIIPEVMKVFTEGDSNTIYWAMQILVGFGDNAVSTLVNIIDDSKKETRAQAILALGMIASQQSISKIARMLVKGDEHECYFIVKSLSNADSFRLVETIINMFPSFDKAICRWFSLVLQNISKNAVQPLLKLLTDKKDPQMIYWILKALKNTRSVSAGEVLKKFLNHEKSEIRLEALESVTEIADLSFSKELIRLLDDPDEEIVKLSITLLLGIADSDLLLKLFYLISENKSDVSIERIKAIEEGLIKSERKNLFDILLKAVEECDSSNRTVLFSLEHIIAFRLSSSDHPLTEILDLIDPGNTDSFNTSLIRILKECGNSLSYTQWVEKFKVFTKESIKYSIMDFVSEYLVSGDSDTKNGIGIFIKASIEENLRYLLLVYYRTDDAMKKISISQFIENMDSQTLKLLEKYTKDENQDISKAADELYKNLKVSLLGIK
jgi:HEAT repeat protein